MYTYAEKELFRQQAEQAKMQVRIFNSGVAMVARIQANEHVRIEPAFFSAEPSRDAVRHDAGRECRDRNGKIRFVVLFAVAAAVAVTVLLV